MPADEKNKVQNEPPIHNRISGQLGSFLLQPPLSEPSWSQSMNTTTRAVIMVASCILVANIVDRMFIMPNLG